ncbi:MAG: NuoI/complex I 23 kDa subunit family protein [Candidatus Binatia bacterium]
MAARAVSVSRPQPMQQHLGRAALAVLVGMWVTNRHFMRNLWGFIRRKPTVFTVQFPEQRLELPNAFRGMPVLVQMDNGKERCVACGLCEWACPTDCITIFPAETADEIERYPAVFDINLSRCMYCGLCEEACPEEAIVMSQRVEVATYTRRAMLWHKEDLLVPVSQLGKRLEHLRRGYDR